MTHTARSQPLTGEALRDLRDLLQGQDPQFSLEHLSKATGVSPSVLLALEEGLAPALEAHQRDLLAQILGVHPQLLPTPEPETPIQVNDTPATNSKNFAAFIRERREALRATDTRYSLRKVAERIGIPAAYLSAIEMGKKAPPNEQTICFLADELGVNRDQLLAMAGKIADDVRAILLSRPILFANLIRELAYKTDEDILMAPAAVSHPRQQAQQRAQETLAILQERGYITPVGRKVDLSHALDTAIEQAITYPPGAFDQSLHLTPQHHTRFRVEPLNALEVLQALIQQRPDARPLVLSFASPVEPGGNFRFGGRGQEQSLVAATGLLPCLQHQPFYDYHQQRSDPFYSDHLVYCPKVPVFRDPQGRLLDSPLECAFIAASAVNAREVERREPQRRGDIGSVMHQRILQVLGCAAQQGHDTLILGAWGCGTFGNHPKLIAHLFHEALTGTFAGVFHTVIFAIPDTAPGEPHIGPFRALFDGAAIPNWATPKSTTPTEDADHSLNLKPVNHETTQQTAPSTHFMRRSPQERSRLDRTLDADALESALEKARQQYRTLRIRVAHADLSAADRTGSPDEHNGFRHEAFRVCEAADLNRYRSPSPSVRALLWRQIWTKNRYSSVRASVAEREIDDIGELFDDFRWFADPCWDTVNKGHQLLQAGSCIQDFLGQTGPFSGKHTVGNVPKLVRLVHIARAFKDYFEIHQGKDAISFITGGLPEEAIGDILARLHSLGYGGELTGLDLLMDLGFPVIKPDIVRTRVFWQLGWLSHIIPELPDDLTEHDLQGRGPYKHRYVYTSRRLYQPMIEFSNRLIMGLDPQDLEKDIGWVTPNPFREFALVCDVAADRSLINPL